MRKQIALMGFIMVSIFIIACDPRAIDQHSFGSSEWKEYLGGPERNHYSPLGQIDTSNVHQLRVAWEYHTTDSGQMQCNPIIVNGLLYGITAKAEPFALDAATGKELWRIKNDNTEQYNTVRGVSYWERGTDKRILYSSGEWLYAVDAMTGVKVSTFGESGKISLKAGLGTSAVDKMVISNTPGTVYEDLIYMPLRLSEGNDAALGHIQAFNVVTGKLAWVFHTIPMPGEEGYDTWPKEAYTNVEVGGGNNWSGMAIDQQRGILYVPTGSAAFDFYGGNRAGVNLFTNCLLALDARTGKRIWHYQFVHHDILDRDPPAPPNLVTIYRQGKAVDAVVQVTKQGYVFVFDRENGSPLFPIEERPAPVSDVHGERAWPTQPVPLKPMPYARQTFSEQDVSPLAENRQELIDSLKRSRSEGPFTPLSARSTIVYPGLDGGAEWGGAGVDPNGILYINSNEMAWRISLTPSLAKERLAAMTVGQGIYTTNCVSCHGSDRRGNPQSGFPALLTIADKYAKEDLNTIISSGRGMMPAFTKLTTAEKEALMGYLLGEEITKPGLTKEPGLDKKSTKQALYQISGYSKFLDKNGYPAVRPPWGTLNAIDLNTGEYLWKITFGEVKELIDKGIPPTGTESYGGPVITASGLLFIAATKDGKFRAYDKTNGKLLWETKLPAAGFATPSTYMAQGKQYVVIACGGEKLGTPTGDSYVAFALP